MTSSLDASGLARPSEAWAFLVVQGLVTGGVDELEEFTCIVQQTAAGCAGPSRASIVASALRLMPWVIQDAVIRDPCGELAKTRLQQLQTWRKPYKLDRKEYSERLKFEHDLIGRRTTWLITSQAILFATYGYVFQKEPRFAKMIARTGAATAGLILIGVIAALSAKYCTWQDFRKTPGNTEEPFWVRTWITAVGMVPECGLPLLFVGVWVYILFGI